MKPSNFSGIVNGANRYAIEVEDDSVYALNIFQRIIMASLEVIEIFKTLPPFGELS